MCRKAHGAVIEDQHPVAGAREVVRGDEFVDAGADDKRWLFLFRHGLAGGRSSSAPADRRDSTGLPSPAWALPLRHLGQEACCSGSSSVRFRGQEQSFELW